MPSHFTVAISRQVDTALRSNLDSVLVLRIEPTAVWRA